MGPAVKLLGKPYIGYGDAEVEPTAGRTAALLYYVAYQASWVPREDLLYLFWPDREERKGRANLRQLLVGVRRLDYARGVEIERTRMRWQVESDVDRFRALLEENRSERAAEVYTGPLLQGFRLRDAPEFDSWLELERDVLHGRWREACVEHARALEGQRRLAEAAVHLERLVEADPIDEEALRLLLVAWGESGRRAEATKRFDAFRQEISEELGIEPEAATFAVARALSEASGGAGDVVAAAASVGGGTGRRGLPKPATELVGRSEELSLLEELLLSPGGLVTLLGPGGIGKSRLAIEAARRVAGALRNGACFVPLAGASSATEIAPAAAGALGLTLHPERDPLEQLLKELQGKEILLVLDNLEHLSEVADVLQRIREEAPGVSTLTTSRVRLGLSFERVIELGGLPFPERDEAHEIQHFESAQLFADRAGRLDSSFSLDDHRAEVAHVCKLTAGMPLALELASAWLRVLPMAGIVDELEQGLDLLVATEVDVPERHGSIHRVFEASWGLLSDTERAALARLSVFRGGFTREAAREVAEVGLPLLLALRNKSFLTVDASGRFGQHPLIERFVQKRVAHSSEDLLEVQRRHAEYLFAFVEEREAAQNSPAQRKALTEILAERANVDAAWRWSVRAGRSDLHPPVKYLTFLAYQLSGRYEEFHELVEYSLNVFPESSEAWAHLAIAWSELLEDEVRHQEAHALRLRALAAYRIVENDREVADTLYRVGRSAFYMERLDEARRWWAEAETMYRGQARMDGVGKVLNSLASATRSQAERERLFREAADALANTDAVVVKVILLNNQSVHLARTSGDYDGAIELIEQAIAMGRKLGDLFRLAFLLGNASSVYRARGDLDAASARAGEAIGVMRPFDTPEAELNRQWARLALARVHLASGDVAPAAQIVDAVKETLAEGSWYRIRKKKAAFLQLLAELMLVRGDPEGAERLARESLVSTEHIPFQLDKCMYRVHSLVLLAEATLASGDAGMARNSLSEALRLTGEMLLLPSTLHAFVVAAPLLPEPKARELAILAAHHPATPFEIRQRARKMLGAAGPDRTAPRVTPEQIFATSAELFPKDPGGASTVVPHGRSE